MYKIEPRDELNAMTRGEKLTKQVNKNINDKVVEHIVWWCKEPGAKYAYFSLKS